MSPILTMTVSSGTSITLSRFAGIGIPRLFEGSSLYVYRLARTLLRSDNAGLSWSSIGNSTTPRAICQDGSGLQPKTLIFTLSGIGTVSGYYQSTPETAGGWSATGALPSGFSSSDAISDFQGSIGILVGNIHSGTESRIVKSPRQSPYTFTDSDSGIPQSGGSIALITDLEMAE